MPSHAVLSKLRSPDQDIRFMCLNDLLTDPFNDGTQWDPSILEAVVNCLGDTSVNVQNQSVKLIAAISSSNKSTAAFLVPLILNQRAPDPVRGSALKHTLAAGDMPQPLVDNLVELLRQSVFEHVEGIDALTELARGSTLSPDAVSQLMEHLIFLIQSRSTHTMDRLPAVEALSFVIPQLEEAVWETKVKPFIIDNGLNPLFVVLVGKLAHRVPKTWLTVDLSSIVIQSLLDVELETGCEKWVETNIKTLAELANASSDIREKQADNLKDIVGRMLSFRDLDVYSGSEPSDSDTHTEFEEGDFGWVDATSVIRQAACKLAVATKNGECISQILNAISKEIDEATRVCMYQALGQLYTDTEFEGRRHLSSTLKHQVGKDISKQRLGAIDSGIESLIKVDGYISPKILRDYMRLVPVEAFKFIEYLVRSSNVLVNELRKRTVDRELVENDISDIRAIVKEMLESETLTMLPERLVVRALDLCRWCGFSDLLDRIGLLLQEVSSKAVLVAALDAIESLVTTKERIFDADLLSVQLLKQANKYEDGQTDNVVVLEALKSLTQLVSQHTIAETTKNEIIVTCRRIFDMATLNKVETLASATRLLQAVGGGHHINEAAAIITSLNNKQLVIGIQNSLVADELISRKEVSRWAIRHEALELIARIAGSKDQFTSMMSLCLTESEVPEVHAAAASGTPNGWRALTEYYSYGTTEFAQLSEPQLRTLLALCQRNCCWTWYSINEVGQGLVSDLHCKIYGSLLALLSEDVKADALQVMPLDGHQLETVFVSYVRQIKKPRDMIGLMKDHPKLRIARAAVFATPEPEMLNLFIGTFVTTAPLFLLETFQLHKSPKFFPHMWKALRSMIDDDKKYNIDVRTEALSTMKWIFQAQALRVQHPSDRDLQNHLNQALQVVLHAMVPDKSFVETINIGPLKHKVDHSAPLRHTSLDFLYTFFVPNLSKYDAKLANEAVSVIVNESLRDEEHGVKLMAYKILTELLKQNHGLVRQHYDGIVAVIREDENKTVKASAVKQDVEKRSDLLGAIDEIKKTLL